MNAPGTLRHSRAHREAIKRIQGRELWLWNVAIPQRLPDAAVRLPAGARVVDSEYVMYLNARKLAVVASGRNPPIALNSSVTITRIRRTDVREVDAMEQREAHGLPSYSGVGRA